MKYLTHTNNHEVIAEEYLLEQYKRRPKIESLLKALIHPIQNIEDAIYKMYLQGMLSEAKAEYLDRLGAIVGVERKARTDNEYRFAINIGITLNNSGGTPEDIISVIQNIYDVEQLIYFEYGNAYFELFLQLKNTDIPSGIIHLLDILKPAGVSKPTITYSNTDNIFRFAERVNEIQQAEVQDKTNKYDLQVADTDSTNAELDIMYDGYNAIFLTKGFGEIIVTKPNLRLDDNAEYLVDINDNLEMLLSFEDFIVQGGSEYVEVTNL